MATGRRAAGLLVEGVPEEELCVQRPGWRPPQDNATPARGRAGRASRSAELKAEYLVYDHKLLRATSKMDEAPAGGWEGPKRHISPPQLRSAVTRSSDSALLLLWLRCVPGCPGLRPPA